MLFTLAISVFFGLVAAFALLVNAAMVKRGIRAAREIRAELASIDRGAVPARVRPGRAAFA
jgi:hypothetical protein